jgi:hypothetical protein
MESGLKDLCRAAALSIHNLGVKDAIHLLMLFCFTELGFLPNPLTLRETKIKDVLFITTFVSRAASLAKRPL